MDFKKGDRVVHRAHGVGEIVAIETKTFDDVDETCYILEIQDNGAPKKVFIPVETASGAIRRPYTGAKRQAIIDDLQVPAKASPVDHQTWNRRYRAYMESVHSGEIEELVKVFKALSRLRVKKDLSFGERKLFDQCKYLLENELDIQL